MQFTIMGVRTCGRNQVIPVLPVGRSHTYASPASRCNLFRSLFRTVIPRTKWHFFPGHLTMLLTEQYLQTSRYAVDLFLVPNLSKPGTGTNLHLIL